MTRVIAALLLMIVVGGALYAIETGDNLAVSVREGELRTGPGFLSRIDTRVQYGEAVTVLGVRGDWVRVRVDVSRDEGWMHSSAVLPPAEMNLTGTSSGTTGTTSREIALAGRGFSERVEKEYQEQEQLDFAAVDEMETYIVPLPELGEFLAAVDAEIQDAEIEEVE
jgi:uncharacterized protein YgiM (DUF1202 family)